MVIWTNRFIWLEHKVAGNTNTVRLKNISIREDGQATWVRPKLY